MEFLQASLESEKRAKVKGLQEAPDIDKFEIALALLDYGDSNKRQTKTELYKARIAVVKKGTSSGYRADAHNI